MSRKAAEQKVAQLAGRFDGKKGGQQMGIRFRRRVKILPGVYLNIGKHGVSTSVGARGAHVTVGKNGVRTTVSVPGTRVSYTHLERRHAGTDTQAVADAAPAERPSAARGYLWAAIILAIVLALTFLR